MADRTEVARLVLGAGVAAGALAAWYTNPGAKLPVEGELVRVVVGLAFVASGSVARIYFGNRRIALLMTVVGVTWFAWDLAWIYLPIPYTLGILLGSAFQPVLAHLAIAFPSGSLRSRLDRAVVGINYGVWFAFALAIMLFWDPRVDCPIGCSINLLLVDADRGIHDSVEATGTIVGLLLTLAVIAVIVRHWFTAHRAGRRALAPVLWSAWPMAAVLVAIGLAGRAEVPPVATIALTALPIGFVLGLFRIEHAKASVGNLVIELGRQRSPQELRAALARTLRDPDLDLLYWSRDSARFVDHAGQPMTLPEPGSGRTSTILDKSGTPIAALVHDSALDEQREVVEAAAAAATLAIENERLHAEIRAQLQEVRASRVRLVEAADAARRRLERDLHDGSQQHLVTLAIQLGLAQARLADHPDPDLAAVLDDAVKELRVALAEIRHLARGIHPAILTDAGLGPALASLADRCPVPVTISAVPEVRYPTSVESTVYFVVAESMTNAAKHAHASQVVVTAEQLDGHLRVEVKDDGIGGASLCHGSGLQGLADRVGALDGQLHVDSPAQGGTRVTAIIPCRTS
jgi:signal transduction histidine kinase